MGLTGRKHPSVNIVKTRGSIRPRIPVCHSGVYWGTSTVVSVLCGRNYCGVLRFVLRWNNLLPGELNVAFGLYYAAHQDVLLATKSRRETPYLAGYGDRSRDNLLDRNLRRVREPWNQGSSTIHYRS